MGQYSTIHYTCLRYCYKTCTYLCNQTPPLELSTLRPSLSRDLASFQYPLIYLDLLHLFIRFFWFLLNVINHLHVRDPILLDFILIMIPCQILPTIKEIFPGANAWNRRMLRRTGCPIYVSHCCLYVYVRPISRFLNSDNIGVVAICLIVVLYVLFVLCL